MSTSILLTIGAVERKRLLGLEGAGEARDPFGVRSPADEVILLTATGTPFDGIRQRSIETVEVAITLPDAVQLYRALRAQLVEALEQGALHVPGGDL